ncbi:neuroguidin-like isoform X2 [Pollicipes pollicipes]|uniref:neuroguidin-like isoform X2 n=1 Tax=Pollicipes pollicipes TaxID=41117 RepID=UPI00188595BD|nr:neuroguidin-like isoform X2 [Pollicipes pollicipes]
MDMAVEDVSSADMARAKTLLDDLSDGIGKTSSLVAALTAKVKDGQLDTAHGLSFLEMKNYLLLSYLADLTQVMSLKLRGRSIAGDASVDRLVELRTVLERIRPIDQKLRYQVDKLVRIATTGQLGEGDPLRFKPQPGNLASRLDDEAGSGSDSDEPAAGAGRQKSDGAALYVPPRIAAVPYDGDETAESRRERRLAAARRRALSSSVMQELGRQYLDTPEEVHDLSDTYRNRSTREEAERTKYEEDFMVRLPETKQDQRRRRELTTDWSLGEELTQRADLSALEGRLPGRGNKRRRAAAASSAGPKRRKGKGNKKPRFSL